MVAGKAAKSILVSKGVADAASFLDCYTNMGLNGDSVEINGQTNGD